MPWERTWARQVLRRCPGRARVRSYRISQGIHDMDELLVVTTGGTIDKVYFDDKSDYQIGKPQIGRILEDLGVAFRFQVIPILRKDSLHITAEDRELPRRSEEHTSELQSLMRISYAVFC